jgi:FkbM family methyltransferase
MHDRETFVDAGSHHGDVTTEFIRITNGKFSMIGAFDPDIENNRMFSKRIHDKRIHLIPYALHEKSGVAKFHYGLDHASQISDTGKDYVATYELDSFHMPATFIKMHLEGAELPALKGSKHTLLGSRPIIAATICHNEDGLWKTPLWLMSLLEDYKFLLRLHCWCGSNAVIYAIPNERIR